MLSNRTRWMVSTSAALLLAISVAAGGATASESVAAVPAVATFVPTLASWHSCGSSECSMLTVPLDYRNPDNGKTVRLAVSRLAAAPQAGAYAGIMVVNPGGPGAPGVGLESLAYNVPGTAARRYDWIGFDPRGVGSSVPALHCNSKYSGNNRPNFIPKTAALLHYWLRKTASYATACGRSAARGLLPYMTSRDTVMDMENLRVALYNEIPILSAKRNQLEKLNYYGFSYGTYLGMVYATLYPARVGRFVLDGVVDPVHAWYRSNIDQDIAFNRNINIYFGWIAQHNTVFHLGTKAAGVRAGFAGELRKLGRHPAAGGKLGPDELLDAMLDAAYYVSDWAIIGKQYANLVRHGQGYPLLGRYASGSQGFDADNGFAVYNAVQCTDEKVPPLSRQLKDTRKVAKTAPFLAWDNTWYNMPCRTWPAPARGKVTVNGAALNALGTKILLINETYDGATPFFGALNVRGTFTGASLIEGYKGTTHAGSLNGVACTDNRIANYLATGAVPTRQRGRRSDLRCPPVRRPAANSARVSARRTTGMSPALHARLVRAQQFG
jgi:pimeloyl-ACP methyl ester carboxylesterase